MNLGDIITTLEAANPDQVVHHGFHNPHSYRGDYYDLAFEPTHNITVAEMLEAARSAVGATYQGYKGGDFKMTASDWCWLSEEGSASGETISPLLLEFMLTPVASPEAPNQTVDQSQLEAAARRALDNLAAFILNSPDPSTEALGAQHELRQALLNATPDIPTTRVWTIESLRYENVWTRWSAPYEEFSQDAHRDYAETVAEWGHKRPFRLVCATTTHVIEAQHQPGKEA